MKRIYFIFFTCLITYSLTGQNFNWKADIERVEQSTYYRIFLKPDITSQLNHSYPDIRIQDSERNEIQYILKKQKTAYNKKKRNELKIIKNKYKKFKHYTEVHIENSENVRVSNLIFKIVNTHNPVFLKIYGSNDSKKWFVLKDNFPAVPEINDTDSTEIKIMDIPECDFSFLKVLFHDYDEKPIELTNVYYHDLANVRSEFIQLTSPKITQKDTLGKSIVTLEFQKPEFVDMISLSIKGPEYYLRNVQMRKKDTSSVPQTGEEFYDQYKKDFYIGSLKSNRINLYDYKAKKIEFIVDNKDNQALKFYKVNAYQLKTYLVTYLKPDEKYIMLYGSNEVSFPSYDLPYFKDTIPQNLPETFISNIKKISGKTENIKKIWTFPPKYLWYIIGLVGIIILLISIKLLKERFGKTKKTE